MIPLLLRRLAKRSNQHVVVHKGPFVRGRNPRTNLRVFTLAAAILCVILTSYSFVVDRPSQVDAASLKKMRSIAETQHEIVMLLLKKKEFSKAAQEASKIFDMKWPVEEEPVLLKELLRFSDQFRLQNQTALGIQLLENNQKAFKTTASRATIWKEKGYLYKSLNQMDKAIECFREAQRLEKP
jgi:tetratricopeptide (TPR) repeat protein